MTDNTSYQDECISACIDIFNEWDPDEISNPAIKRAWEAGEHASIDEAEAPEKPMPCDVRHAYHYHMTNCSSGGSIDGFIVSEVKITTPEVYLELKEQMASELKIDSHEQLSIKSLSYLGEV